MCLQSDRKKRRGRGIQFFCLQHNHFFCNENTNFDLRSFIMPEVEKEEERIFAIFAGNRLNFCRQIWVCCTQHWQLNAFPIQEYESSQTFRVKPCTSSQWLTIDSLLVLNQVLWHCGTQAENWNINQNILYCASHQIFCGFLNSCIGFTIQDSSRISLNDFKIWVPVCRWEVEGSGQNWEHNLEFSYKERISVASLTVFHTFYWFPFSPSKSLRKINP